MKHAKIYTKTGDQGATGLGNRERVDKNSSLIHAIGSVDELNSAIGIIAANTTEVPVEIKQLLATIQRQLFELGAELCLAVKNNINHSDIAWLERQIDKLDSQLPPIKYFILPGGCEAAAYCHLARSICRRAERDAWQASQEYSLNQDCLIFLNRLSDLLFTIARYLNQLANTPDIAWVGRTNRHDEQPT